MPSIQELQPLISEPREELAVEYKDWLDLTANEHKATLAKAAIALANHGGGFIVIGLAEQGSGLHSQACPPTIPEITQDAVNAAIRRYATPEFHCGMYNVKHPKTNVGHPIITVPGTLTVPVMSKRDHLNVIAQNRCYIRKPGPRSEEPRTAEEWRDLLNRCLRAGREDMLEAIRSIVLGRIEPQNPTLNALSELETYCNDARERWKELTADQPAESPARFPQGYYEMGFSLVGARPANGLTEVNDRLSNARRIKLTGWSTFLEIYAQGKSPYPHENFVEAWVGRPPHAAGLECNPEYCDFWRASTDGKLYTIRGYYEDGLEQIQTGKVFYVNFPVWRIAEGLLFASRFAETFEGADEIAIQCCFTGLNGRRLTNGGHSFDFYVGGVSSTDEVTLTNQVTPQQVRDNLVEILHGLLLPLYERFDFFRLPMNLVEGEISDLLKGHF